MKKFFISILACTPFILINTSLATENQKQNTQIKISASPLALTSMYSLFRFIIPLQFSKIKSFNSKGFTLENINLDTVTGAKYEINNLYINSYERQEDINKVNASINQLIYTPPPAITCSKDLKTKTSNPILFNRIHGECFYNNNTSSSAGCNIVINNIITKTNNFNFSNIHINGSISGMNNYLLQKLLSFNVPMAGLDNFFTGDSYISSDFDPSVLSNIIKDGLQINIKKLSFSNKFGTLNVSGNININSGYQGNAGNLWGMNQLNLTNANLQIIISHDLFNYFNLISSNVFLSGKLPQNNNSIKHNKKLNDQVASWIADGYLKTNGDNYLINLKINNGVVTINGLKPKTTDSILQLIAYDLWLGNKAETCG
jgi:hypothetical protein